MKWYLVVNQGQHKGLIIPVKSTHFWIGSDSSCDIRAHSSTVSPRHCVLNVQGGKLYVEEFDRSCETFVNHRRLQEEMELRSGDRIAVGPLRFVVIAKTARVVSTVRRQPVDWENAFGQLLLSMDYDTETSKRCAMPPAATESDERSLSCGDTCPNPDAHAPTIESSVTQVQPTQDTSTAACEILRSYRRKGRKP
jgi:predicted component of type VI protein secretion system